jgi:hypothetical protein
MHEISYSLVTGVISGIIAAGLVFAFRSLWQQILMPWYEELLYKDAKIEGEWSSEITYPEGEKNKHTMRLHRHGHTITGTATCCEGHSKGNEYSLQGSFRNLTLSCTYQINDARRLERGAMVLMLVNDGATLNGSLSYYDNLTNSVKSATCEWIAQGRRSPGL